MTTVHYINEHRSDMRGIKEGWYALEDDGNLSSGARGAAGCSLGRGAPKPWLPRCRRRMRADRPCPEAEAAAWAAWISKPLGGLKWRDQDPNRRTG